MSAPRPRSFDDEALARSLRAGDRHALEATLAALLPDVRRLLARLLGPGAAIDDATQDVLIELAKALRGYEGRASVRTLAYRVTVRHGYRSLARERGRRTVSLELVPPPPDRIDPESRAMSREALSRLYACLDRMPAKRRTAFVLCAIEGLDPADAAEVEGTSAVTMRSRLLHARREIERRLAADPYVGRLVRAANARADEEEDR
ncbi:MAG: sigma-70 family RNA polymerase sigma factor [Sandaracinaceae bacterium]|nr:sigma-70 family RNA polymerase sigma factor [Sandaracinaceae bacterium]